MAGDDILQAIAFENNLSETAFVNLKRSTVRWFTPTLEESYADMQLWQPPESYSMNIFKMKVGLVFSLKAELMLYKRRHDLDFPIDHPTVIESESLITESLKCEPIEILKGRSDYLAILASEKDIKIYNPISHDGETKFERSGSLCRKRKI